MQMNELAFYNLIVVLLFMNFCTLAFHSNKNNNYNYFYRNFGFLFLIFCILSILFIVLSIESSPSFIHGPN